jgi:Uma2 family endonuclease
MLEPMTTVEDIKRAIQRLNLDGWSEVHHFAGQLIESRTRTSMVRQPLAEYNPNPPLMTFEEYLEFVETSPLRYEYVNGVVHAMSGGSVAHGLVTARLMGAVLSHLGGGPCEVFSSTVDLEIRSDTDEITYIPDLMVACNPEEWSEKAIRKPKLVAEVLSPSTRLIDTREKATNYRRVDSIEEILLLEQSQPKITVFRRAERWRPEIYTGTEAVLELRSIGLSVPLAQIYESALSTG